MRTCVIKAWFLVRRPTVIPTSLSKTEIFSPRATGEAWLVWTTRPCTLSYQVLLIRTSMRFWKKKSWGNNTDWCVRSPDVSWSNSTQSWMTRRRDKRLEHLLLEQKLTLAISHSLIKSKKWRTRARTTALVPSARSPESITLTTTITLMAVLK